MKFEVEATGVADRLSLRVSSPERGGVGAAVCADHPRPPVPALQCHTNGHPISSSHVTHVAAGHLGLGRGAPQCGPCGPPDPCARSDPVHFAVIGAAVAQL